MVRKRHFFRSSRRPARPQVIQLERTELSYKDPGKLGPIGIVLVIAAGIWAWNITPSSKEMAKDTKSQAQVQCKDSLVGQDFAEYYGSSDRFCACVGETLPEPGRLYNVLNDYQELKADLAATNAVVMCSAEERKALGITDSQ